MKQPLLNLPNLLLAGATLLLSGAAIYCARGLERERTPPAAIRDAAFPAGQEGTAVMSAGALPAAGVEVSEASLPPARSAGELAVARYRLARLADPQGRAEKAAQFTGIRSDWNDLAPFAGLTQEDVDGLVAHAVEARLQGLEQRYACEADVACEPAAHGAAEAMPDGQLARIVGAAKAARIEAHQAALEEHQFIRMLRALTVAGNLGDADAGRLALALAEERQRFGQAAVQAGAVEEKVDGPFVGHYMRIAVPPGAPHETQRRLESAAQYNARLYARAAQILQDQPLARFRAIQEAAMDAYRRSLREREVVRAARAAQTKRADP